MKMKKGLLALALSFATILTSCGGGNKDSNDTSNEQKAGSQSEVTSGEATEANEDLSGEISVQVEEAWQDYYQAAADRVTKKYPNVKINFITMGSFDHLDVIDSTDATNEDVADLFAIPADRLYGLAKNEILAGIDSQKLAKEIGGWDDFDAGLGGNFKIDDEYLAFPYNIETLITFVNKKNAEDEGIDPSKPIEFTELKKPETALLPLFDARYGVAATNSSEIELLGKKDDDSLYTDMTTDFKDLPEEKQKTFEAIYDYRKLHNDGGTPLFDADAGWAYIDDTFTTGNGGVVRLGGPWDTATISDQAGEGNLEIHPMDEITIAGKPLRHRKGGRGLAINSRVEDDADKMAIAEEMIKEIVNPEYAEDLFTATGKILENVPSETYAASNLSETDKAVIDATIKSYEAAPARPLFEEWGKVWDTWKNAVLSWNSVKPASAEDAYKELQSSFESMMKTF